MKNSVFILLFLLSGCGINNQTSLQKTKVQAAQIYQNDHCQIIFFGDSVYILSYLSNDNYSYGSWHMFSENLIYLNSSYLPFENLDHQIRDAYRLSSGFINLDSAKVMVKSPKLIELYSYNYGTERMLLDSTNFNSGEILKYRKHILELKEKLTN
jgi:hypothetical protein